MTATITPTDQPAPAIDTTPIVLTRPKIDRLLIGAGVIATIALIVAATLLSWGAKFSADYVGDELSAQNITFPDAEQLTGEGRTDLLEFAGQPLDTGAEAEAYASYIDGHLTDVAGGATYSELGGPERTAKAAVSDAVEAGAADSEIAELQAAADEVSGQRNTLFKGETLRGLLLSAYAWATVGSIAAYAAIAAWIVAALFAGLVVLGALHMRRQHNI